MDIRKLDDGFHVSGQIHPEQMHALAARGYKAILCNRPDNEAPGQPDFATIRAAAEAAGLQARYVPIVHGRVGPADEAAFAAAVRELPKPVLAFCRSGARSESLYQGVGRRAA